MIYLKARPIWIDSSFRRPLKTEVFAGPVTVLIMLLSALDWLPEGLWIPPFGLFRMGSYISLAYTTCEWLHGLPFEVGNIWRYSDIPFSLRCAYICARYLGLIGQVRVLALWNNDQRIAILLALLLITDLGTSIILTPMAMKETVYVNKNCFKIVNFPRAVTFFMVWDVWFLPHSRSFTVLFSGIKLFTQICFWTLASIKYKSFGRSLTTQGKTVQMISRLNRENMMIAFLACRKANFTKCHRTELSDTKSCPAAVIPATVLADGVRNLIPDMTNAGSYPAVPVLLSIVTSATCRTIKAMHCNRLKLLRETDGEEEGIGLTSLNSDNFDDQ
ncbi:hypothetical protein NP233_g5292 [Leucocoprinus birnbaumii]|uniref:Uncharacterized protein n=1 Tax=Leucocoprinus birnbaumii TaxID=56174 RepID=A0AAD5VT50_9AGAR|nr:hypothetical protein NP233_g5292 [Leucocoprinus birnbaumii]